MISDACLCFKDGHRQPHDCVLGAADSLLSACHHFDMLRLRQCIALQHLHAIGKGVRVVAAAAAAAVVITVTCITVTLQLAKAASMKGIGHNYM